MSGAPKQAYGSQAYGFVNQCQRLRTFESSEREQTLGNGGPDSDLFLSRGSPFNQQLITAEGFLSWSNLYKGLSLTPRRGI